MLVSRIGRIALACALGAVAATTSSGTATVAADDGHHVKCESVRIPVAVAGGNYSLAGSLCVPHDSDRTVELLLHGITYGHVYWDPAYQTEMYSYVRSANAAGIATLNIDRIGIGASDHPPADAVTTQANVDMVHQIITQLRSGAIDHQRFARVVLVGHSFGTIMSVLETAQYGDADALLLTGFMHTLDFADIAYVAAQLVPTQVDPVLASQNDPPGYLTTQQGQRGVLFYSPADTDPGMVAYDEQSKQTVTSGEFATFPAYLNPAYSMNVHVPVFLGMGQNDRFFCDTSVGLACDSASDIVAREQPLFANAASFTGFVLPGSGHVMNNELNAHEWFDAANAWEKSILPEHGAR